MGRLHHPEKRAARSLGKRIPSQCFSWFGYCGQAKTLHLLMGLPSAILGRAAVVRNRVIAANANRNRFTVVLLGERVRTVLRCLRQRVFLYLVKFRCFSVNCKFDETSIRSRGL